MFLTESNGFSSFSIASRPASLRALRTVRSLTSTLSSVLSFLFTATAVSTPPEVIVRTQNLLFCEDNFGGRPPEDMGISGRYLERILRTVAAHTPVLLATFLALKPCWRRDTI